MSSSSVSPFRKAWLRWKSLKLPWRKRYLVGLDLQGNTFWEFRDALSSNRMRRIVQYPSSTHYSEIRISPQWHQWLRHTRADPPSLTEQSQDLIRQENLKVLAAQADARWAAKPSFLDAPGRGRGQPLPTLEVKELRGYVKSIESAEKMGVRDAIGGLGDTVQSTQTSVVDTVGSEEHKDKRQVADGLRHHFNERPRKEKSQRLKEPKEREDLWEKARGGPSEEWQPKAWDGNIATQR